MKYLKYLKYLLRHKWFVGVACFHEGLCRQGLIHDWSKFLPSEFIPYAEYFYGPKYPSIYETHGDQRNATLDSGCYKERTKDDFDVAWLLHQKRSPHHWQYWVLMEDSGKVACLAMPRKYVMEMLCDWQGAGRAIHGRYNPQDPWQETREWYKKNAGKMLLHDNTRALVQQVLKAQKGGA